ncbi:hypothetical protein Sulku_0718 [Sulfuricurvum kujiense DSM 16994]|uniref:Transformation system protein n=1 Tax=Sulfuricurvum kujiense (strain ATCC BAA-921 / DSM 16994 / JCM 11577 / YK-1) TaxID=709032 RepID=E4U180_SULKY|nr:CDC27 family protein [Sulfuricurvum kujiense]ADR33384.1 hypothetical protein Sulku_0718 [Sulfuricurvum kujiense DSM 16994]
MLDIHTLERRWLKYKIKSYAPYIISALLLLVLSITALSLLNGKESESFVTKDQNSSSEKAHSSLEKTDDSESSNLLEPSMEFVQSFQPSEPEISAPVAVAPKQTQLTQNSIPIPKVLNVPDSGQIQAIAVSSSTKNDKPASLKYNETKMDIESVIRRFKETSDPNLGLFIARYYYAQGNYNDAYNFALKTNNINNKMDESWIIFSKSLVKLGKMDQAKKTLKLYIAESNSDTARSLLDSIEQGTFK